MQDKHRTILVIAECAIIAAGTLVAAAIVPAEHALPVLGTGVALFVGVVLATLMITI